MGDGEPPLASCAQEAKCIRPLRVSALGESCPGFTSNPGTAPSRQHPDSPSVVSASSAHVCEASHGRALSAPCAMRCQGSHAPARSVQAGGCRHHAAIAGIANTAESAPPARTAPCTPRPDASRSLCSGKDRNALPYCRRGSTAVSVFCGLCLVDEL